MELPLKYRILPHDIRELLQYVPQFVGKVFAVELRWGGLSDHLKSEAMLDFAMLQSVGVKLVIVVEPEAVANLLDWAIEVDLRLENDVQSDAAGIKEVLARGQFAIVHAGEGSLSSGVTEVLLGVEVDKVLLLLEKIGSGVSEGGSVSQEQWRKRESEWDFSPAVLELLDGGVSRVHLLDASLPGVILAELFSNEGSGLMVYRDSYRQVRPVTTEDIPELLTMIGRSVRTSLLVPREYEDIERSLEDYYLYQIDENVVGCVALHRYPDGWGEVACLYVKQGHQGLGYGEKLVEFAERQAKESGVKRIFALTTGAADFFRGRMGYSEMDVGSIPAERLAALRASGRDSLAFSKTL